MARLVTAFLLLVSTAAHVWCGDATPNGDAFNVPKLSVPVERELSAADKAYVNDATEAINDTLTGKYPGNIDPLSADWNDIRKRREADRTKEIEEMMKAYERVQNGYSVTKLGEVPILGTVSVESRVVQQKRSYSADVFGVPGPSFKVIEASGNLLEDANKKLKNLSNKLSKHACGNFDWLAQLKAKFRKEALEQYVDSLANSALAAAPMALLATWSPTLYEIVKWLRMFAASDLEMQASNCQRMEAAMADIGNRMSRGAGYPECMKQHKDINYTEANKTCNGGSSAFDGLENWMGQLKSLGTTNDTIDVVAEAGRYGSENVVAQKSALYNQAIKDRDKAQANFDATPVPGTQPPVTDPGYTAWKRSSDRYLRAKTELDEANETVENLESPSILSNSDKFSVWDTLQYAVAKNAGDLFGSIKITGRFDLDIGRQDKLFFKLCVDHNGYKLQLDLETALQQHFDIIASQFNGSGFYTQDDLFQSYKALMILCYESMQLRDSSKPGVYFDESTIDKMAFLFVMYKDLPSSADIRTVIENRYRINAHLRNVTCYEIAAYGKSEWVKERQKWLDQIKQYLLGSQNPQMPHIMKIMEERAKEIDGFWEELAGQWKARVIETLPYVNSFHYRHKGGRQFGAAPPVYAAPSDLPAVYLP
jgi:hypothetical protein